jgi:uncharacterized protein YyaL (SSP411 family)
MNQLFAETSPYLLQHANNPVHWKAWNENTLAKAKKENKLIIISIGYSACHWCHVMEHESFENNHVASVMNAHFINIKVDREERPDLDATYMKAIQIMTGRGGWPLNVVALPDGRPIWGGTYFQKDEWTNTLSQLQEMYLSQPEKMIEYAEKLALGIQSLQPLFDNDSPQIMNQDALVPLVEKWKKSFDLDFGGTAKAPKFMMPNNLQFLLRYAHQNKDAETQKHVHLTLKKMAFGGLFDTVGGGFSRYSVDLKWHIPHFEKMLYDNGQLVSLYSNAYKLSPNYLYKEVVEKTLDFVINELTNSEGGFYCAIDADSLNEEQKLVEGAFYVWEKEELQKIIKDDFDLFSQVFNINEFGYWEDKKYVLIQNQELETIAKNNAIDCSKLQSKKKNWEILLYNERKKRNRPRLDDKSLTSWNAIMLKGFVDAHKAFGTKKYLDIALKNAHFILDNLWSNDGNLWHNYKNKKATINGYLEDYCFTIEAFISLYEVTLDENWLHRAKQLTDYCFDYFYDDQIEFFRFTSRDDAPLIAPHFEIEDNVIPSSNSVMGNNLYQLSIYFNNNHYRTVCTKMVQKIIPSIDYPSAFSNWLYLFMNTSERQKELAICGKNTFGFISKINSNYYPNVTLAGTEKESQLPFLKNRFIENETLFYICQEQTCELPSTNFDEVLRKIT